MYCLKCGAETDECHVFCRSCMESMEKYPVKPGTPVQLPHRDPSDNPRRQPHRKRTQTLEEQIMHLRKANRWLFSAVVIIFIAFCIVAGILLHNLFVPQKDKDTGRNYTTIETGDIP